MVEEALVRLAMVAMEMVESVEGREAEGEERVREVWSQLANKLVFFYFLQLINITSVINQLRRRVSLFLSLSLFSLPLPVSLPPSLLLSFPPSLPSSPTLSLPLSCSCPPVDAGRGVAGSCGHCCTSLQVLSRVNCLRSNRLAENDHTQVAAR